jgi:Phage tail tube protein, GTA-gp10
MAAVDGFGRATFDWGDGEHTFRLTFKGICELEARIDRGILWLYRELERGEAKLEHIREVHRIGLIGGGMEPVAAIKLVRTYIEESPNILANTSTAKLILLPVLLEPKADALPKAPRRRKSKTVGGSPSRVSSEQPAQSA